MAGDARGENATEARVARGQTDGRSRLLLGLAAVCLVALIGRLVQINATMRDDDHRLAQHVSQQQRFTVPLAARRGEILDVHGRVLAGSQQRPSVFADPVSVMDPEAAAKDLAPLLETRPARVHARAAKIREQLDLARAATHPIRFVWLERGIDREQEEPIRRLIDPVDVPLNPDNPKSPKKRLPPRIAGVGIVYEPFRRYPMHTVAAHLVGCVDIDSKGIEGIESRYDTVLTGTPGFMTMYCDAGRRPMWPAEGGFHPPRDGMTVRLTIDAAIQEVLDAQVAEAVAHYKAESGVGIVMNPKTGDMLAMTSVPTFDPNDPGASLLEARRPRFLTDPAEPGSTFKPLVAAAALAEKVVRPGEIINCHGGTLDLGARKLHDAHAYGDLTFEQIVIRSSNIGMALIGMRLGNERIYRYLSAPAGYGFGSRTGIELDGEDPGLLLPFRKWTSFSTASLPMGQEIAVTPLQLANAFSTIVNGGKCLRPRVVRAIVDPRGEVVQEFTGPQVLRQVLPPDVAEFMTKTVLVGVVSDDHGTGRRAALPQYQVLGKTGTAQIARKNGGGYLPDAYTASFVGAAPASDPALVVLVMIRHPQRSIGHFGGTVSAPVVREVLGRSLAYLGVPPDKKPDDGPEVRQARQGGTRRLAPDW